MVTFIITKKLLKKKQFGTPIQFLLQKLATLLLKLFSIFLLLTLSNNFTAMTSFYEHTEQNTFEMFQITPKVLTPLKVNRLKLPVVSVFSNMLYGK